jgi:DNA repair exonuclease SbcCD ATPase subunit
MRIRSIRIKDFRKLIGPVSIDEIGDGITVISGDNEEGKSTVLEAIRTVLFTRHRISGDTADRMQPFGQSVRPEISLDFEIDGTRYALRKVFCRRPEAELTCASRVTRPRTSSKSSFASSLPERVPRRPSTRGSGDCSGWPRAPRSAPCA